MTIERVRVCKRDGVLLSRPDTLPGKDFDGRPLHQKLMVYTSEDSLYDGIPIHRALIRRLRKAHCASGGNGVTRYVGGVPRRSAPPAR